MKYYYYYTLHGLGSSCLDSFVKFTICMFPFGNPWINVKINLKNVVQT
jgi:hypothetical protein